MNQWLPWKQLQSLSKIKRLLFVTIWLISVVVYVLVIHSEKASKHAQNNDIRVTKRQKWRLSSLGGEGNQTLSHTSDGDFERWRLTKSIYPLTLTAPFLITNEHICAADVTLLIIVHTAIFHFDRRIQLRLTIGNTKLFKHKYKIRIAFLLGTTTDATANLLLKQENDKYGDLVQGDFLDTYRNLTLKGVMGFRWVNQYCPHARMVLKIDDDIFVNVFKIMGYYYPLHKRRKHLLLCNTVFPGPILRKRARWMIDSDDFRWRKHYPRYCSGFAVLMSRDTIRALLQAAQFTPVFWIDDVYLFGLLPTMADITHRVLNHNITLYTEECEDSYMKEDPELVACTASRTYEFMFYWKRSVKTLRPPIKELVNDDVIDNIVYSAEDKIIMGRKH